MLVYYFNLRAIHPPLNIYSELEKMLALRKIGMSYTELAQEFNTPQNTIVYLCQKFGLGGANKPPIRHTTRIPVDILYNVPSESDDYRNKTYTDYLQDERNRKWNRLTQGHIKSA